MAEHNTPADLRREIDAMKRQMRQLQANNRLAAAAIRGSTLVFQEAGGTTRLALGAVEFEPGFGSSAGYGLFEYDTHGALVRGIDENRHGVMFPPREIPMHSTIARTTTSATFDGLWEGGFADATHDTIFVSCAIQSSADTAGEVRLHGINNNTSTDAVTIPAGTNSFVQFEWLHPYTVGAFDDRSDRVAEFDVMQIQARRTAGTGTLTLFGPRHFLLTSTWLQPGANVNGGGQLL